MRINKELSDFLAKIDKKYEVYLNNQGKIIAKLSKALYGCVESAKL